MAPLYINRLKGFSFCDKLVEVADIGVMSDIRITHLEILPRFISHKFNKFASPHDCLTAGEICY